MKTENNEHAGKRAVSYIRFSSRKQRFGRSVERQLKQTIEFCTKYDLALDLDSSIRDLGLSSFRGENTDTGNLSAFITGVKTGKIETPVVLVVESLDRISRNEIVEATNLLTELLMLGVEIGLTIDDRIITKKLCDRNPDLLHLCMSHLIRGRNESETKSNRTKDFVNTRKPQLETKTPCKLGGYLPPWYKFDGKVFIPQPEKIQTVKRIFALYLDGNGTTKIVKEVKDLPKWNNTGAKTKAGGVRSLLTNKQVIGTIKLAGIEYPDYLPAIVSKDDFDRVQVLLGKNRTRHGKHDANANNLFNGLLFCDKCGGNLNCHKSSSRNYFYCNNSRDYACTEKQYYAVDKIEVLIFGVLLKNSPSIMIAQSEMEPQREIRKLETELATLARKREKVQSALLDETTSFAELKPMLASIKQDFAKTETALMQARVKAAENRKAPANLSGLVQLISRDMKDETIRHKVKNLLPSIIERIDVGLSGDTLRVQLRTGQVLGGTWQD
jgi:DNA invertase Pin-like site-specific DNA recombinase